MDKGFAKLFESDVDVVAPILAKTTAAGAIYLWLISRTFYFRLTGRGISQKKLADILGKSETAVRDAVDRLEELGLLRVVTRRGDNGGTWYDLLKMPALDESLSEYFANNPNSGYPIYAIPDRQSSENTTSNQANSGKQLSENAREIPRESTNNKDKNNKDNLDKEKDESLLVLTEEVIGYLNDRAGTSFKANQSCQKLIRMWRGEGYGLDDFKRVVDNKCSEWLGTDFQTNLKPKTLFSSEHFEEYLNQLGAPAPTTNKQNGGNQNGYISEYDRPLESDFVA